jgi:hypothetical protein
VLIDQLQIGVCFAGKLQYERADLIEAMEEDGKANDKSGNSQDQLLVSLVPNNDLARRFRSPPQH